MKATCNPAISASQRSFIAMTRHRINSILLETARPYLESRERFQRSLDYWLDLSFKEEDAKKLKEGPKRIKEARGKVVAWANTRFRRRNIPFSFATTHK